MALLTFNDKYLLPFQAAGFELIQREELRQYRNFHPFGLLKTIVSAVCSGEFSASKSMFLSLSSHLCSMA